MKITVITVGKIKEKYLKDAIAEYSKRLSRYCKLEILEVADEKTPDGASEIVEENIREKEGERILKLIKEDAYVITLEISGKRSHKLSIFCPTGLFNLNIILAVMAIPSLPA